VVDCFHSDLAPGSHSRDPARLFRQYADMETTQPTARLVVQEGDRTRTVPIDPLPFTIGRLADRHLRLENTHVSREHAVIQRDADGFFIQDMGSSSGTLVNGNRIEHVRLNLGDRIQLGSSGIVLHFTNIPEQTSARSLLNRISGEAAGSELDQLSLFLQAAQSFNSTRVLHDVLNTMVEYTLRLTGAERGFVFLGDSPATLQLEAGLSNEGLPLIDDSRISRSIVRDAATSGQEYYIGDATGDGQAVGRHSMVLHDLMSVIAIPLRSRNTDRLLGLLYLDSRLRTSTLNRVSRDILHAIATEAANLVENARMVQAERAADLMRNELAIAASIQQSILPADLPAFPGARLLARTISCTEVGGDFYDVIPVDDGFIGIVADVSGKGMPAALLASVIQGMMYAQLKSGASLVDAVLTVNTFLCSRVSGQKYVTLAAAHCKPGGSVDLINCGHVPPILIHPNGRVEALTDGDVPVGLICDADFHSISSTLPPGSRLILLSDGITEAEDIAGTQFGSTDITADLTSPEPIEAIFTSMQRFCRGVQPADDRTMLVIDATI
jgi:serine phosphatase RsbU (regulator of sigma subunit)/pSer/pThr/pTyr-binding forkhead associated (FHA) protein